MQKTRLILASSSPRRIDLLQCAGFAPRVIKPDVDERVLPQEAPRSLVRRLSRSKALAVAGQAKLPGVRSIIVAADTIVVAPNGRTILNKPMSKTQAIQMLKTLVGRTHTVLTGYCIVELASGGAKRVLVRVVSSRVKMRKIGVQAIATYVATGEPMDKAGAYAAQGRGMALIEAIQGSYTNVVGLPMSQLLSDLEHQFGYVNP